MLFYEKLLLLIYPSSNASSPLGSHLAGVSYGNYGSCFHFILNNLFGSTKGWVAIKATIGSAEGLSTKRTDIFHKSFALTALATASTSC